MEELIEQKEKANEKMTAGEYDEAISLYNDIICLDPHNDDEAIISCLCLLNRSICKIHKEDLDGALGDAQLVIEVTKKVRPDFSFEKMTEEDKLTSIVALAEYREGQVYESKQEALLALQHYSNSVKICPKAGAQECILRLYGELDLPAIDPEDENLKLFSELIVSLPKEEKVIESLNSILSYFESDSVNDETLDEFADDGVYMLLYAVIQLYINDPVIVTASIVILRKFAEVGILDVFDGTPVIRNVLDHHADNSDVCGAVIRFISMSIKPTTEDEDDFLHPLLHALTIGIAKEEADLVFLMIFNLTRSDALNELKNAGIVDLIFKWKTNSAILLLSKVTSDAEMCKESIKKGAAQIGLNLLKNVTDDILLSSGLILLSHVVMCDNEVAQKIANDVVEKCSSVVTKNSKNASIASKGISLFTQVLPLAVQKVKELRIVKLVSLIFVVNRKDTSVVKSTIFFLFTAVQNDLIDEIVEIPTLVPSILDSLPAFASNKEVMERAIFLAMVTGHPKGPALVGFGLEKFPDSVIINRIAATLVNK